MAKTKSDEMPMATVEMGPDGKVYLNDPVGYAVMGAVERVNLYRADPVAVERLEKRAAEKTHEEGSHFVVVLIDMDDPFWHGFGEVLMPDADWRPFRERGEKPMARGVIPRKLLVDVLNDTKTDFPFDLPDALTAVFSMNGVSYFRPGGKPFP